VTTRLQHVTPSYPPDGALDGRRGLVIPRCAARPEDLLLPEAQLGRLRQLRGLLHETGAGPNDGRAADRLRRCRAATTRSGDACYSISGLPLTLRQWLGEHVGMSDEDADMPPEGQEMFGLYRLEQLIGRGGMGEVWRAYDTVRRRTVAVKRLPAYLAGDVSFQERFRRESRIVACLNEAHIIPIHDYGEIDGRLFLDMRLVEGSDLATLIKRSGPLPASYAVSIIIQVASALEAAHAEGLVHRDLKPSNVLVTKPGDHAYLVDFGIARTASSTVLTATGTTVGTLDYLAPERFLHGEGDRRVDIYALGCVLYEILAGRTPFRGEDLLTLMYAHTTTTPPAPSTTRPDLPSEFDEIVATAMAKDPSDRYQSVAEFADAARMAMTPKTATISLAESHQPNTLVPAEDNNARATQLAEITVGATNTPNARRPSGESPAPASGTPVDGSRATAESDHRARLLTRGTAIKALIALVGVIGIGTVVWARAGLDQRPSPTPTPAASAPTTPAPPTQSQNPANSVVATISVGSGPSEIAISPDGSHAYVTNVAPATVSVIDTSTESVIATIPVGGNPSGIAASPDGRRVLVANYKTYQANSGNTVSVIDTALNRVIDTVPVGNGPNAVSFTPDGTLAYVTNFFSGTVSVINIATNLVINTIPVDAGPQGVVISPDGQRIYVACSGIDANSGNTVNVLARGNGETITKITVGGGPLGLAISPDGRRLYTADSDENDISVIDTTAERVISSISSGPAVDWSKTPAKISVAPNGLYVYVTLSGTTHQLGNSVAIIKTSDNSVIQTVPVGIAPSGIAVSPDSSKVYVTDDGPFDAEGFPNGNTVSVLAGPNH